MTLVPDEILYPFMNADNKVSVHVIKPLTSHYSQIPGPNKDFKELGIPYMTSDKKVAAGRLGPVRAEGKVGFGLMTADGKAVPIKGRPYVMFIQIIQDSTAYFDNESLCQFDVDNWDDELAMEGENQGCKCFGTDTTLSRIWTPPVLIPEDFPVQFIPGPGSVTLDNWKDDIFAPIVDEWGMPQRVCINFLSNSPEEDRLEPEDYDPELGQFLDFLFDDLGLGIAVSALFNQTRWLDNGRRAKEFEKNALDQLFTALGPLSLYEFPDEGVRVKDFPGQVDS